MPTPVAEVGLMLRAIDYAIDFFRGREARTEKEKQLQRDFVEAFRHALILTRSYIADRRDEVSDKDRNREVQLSQAWNKVGMCGRDLEPQGDFYAVYFEKSNFWADPRGWDLSAKKDLDISLERAEGEASKYLSTS